MLGEDNIYLHNTLARAFLWKSTPGHLSGFSTKEQIRLLEVGTLFPIRSQQVRDHFRAQRSRRKGSSASAVNAGATGSGKLSRHVPTDSQATHRELRDPSYQYSSAIPYRARKREIDTAVVILENMLKYHGLPSSYQYGSSIQNIHEEARRCIYSYLGIPFSPLTMEPSDSLEAIDDCSCNLATLHSRNRGFYDANLTGSSTSTAKPSNRSNEDAASFTRTKLLSPHGAPPLWCISGDLARVFSRVSAAVADRLDASVSQKSSKSTRLNYLRSAANVSAAVIRWQFAEYAVASTKRLFALEDVIRKDILDGLRGISSSDSLSANSVRSSTSQLSPAPTIDSSVLIAQKGFGKTRPYEKDASGHTSQQSHNADEAALLPNLPLKPHDTIIVDAACKLITSLSNAVNSSLHNTITRIYQFWKQAATADSAGPGYAFSSSSSSSANEMPLVWTETQKRAYSSARNRLEKSQRGETGSAMEPQLSNSASKDASPAVLSTPAPSQSNTTKTSPVQSETSPNAHPRGLESAANRPSSAQKSHVWVHGESNSPAVALGDWVVPLMDAMRLYIQYGLFNSPQELRSVAPEAYIHHSDYAAPCLETHAQATGLPSLTPQQISRYSQIYSPYSPVPNSEAPISYYNYAYSIIGNSILQNTMSPTSSPDNLHQISPPPALPHPVPGLGVLNEDASSTQLESVLKSSGYLASAILVHFQGVESALKYIQRNAWGYVQEREKSRDRESLPRAKRFEQQGLENDAPVRLLPPSAASDPLALTALIDPLSSEIHPKYKAAFNSVNLTFALMKHLASTVAGLAPFCSATNNAMQSSHEALGYLVHLFNSTSQYLSPQFSPLHYLVNPPPASTVSAWMSVLSQSMQSLIYPQGNAVFHTELHPGQASVTFNSDLRGGTPNGLWSNDLSATDIHWEPVSAEIPTNHSDVSNMAATNSIHSSQKPTGTEYDESVVHPFTTLEHLDPTMQEMAYVVYSTLLHPFAIPEKERAPGLSTLLESSSIRHAGQRSASNTRSVPEYSPLLSIRSTGRLLDSAAIQQALEEQYTHLCDIRENLCNIGFPLQTVVPLPNDCVTSLHREAGTALKGHLFSSQIGGEEHLEGVLKSVLPWGGPLLLPGWKSLPLYSSHPSSDEQGFPSNTLPSALYRLTWSLKHPPRDLTPVSTLSHMVECAEHQPDSNIIYFSSLDALLHYRLREVQDTLVRHFPDSPFSTHSYFHNTLATTNLGDHHVLNTKPTDHSLSTGQSEHSHASLFNNELSTSHSFPALYQKSRIPTESVDVVEPVEPIDAVDEQTIPRKIRKPAASSAYFSDTDSSSDREDDILSELSAYRTPQQVWKK